MAALKSLTSAGNGPEGESELNLKANSLKTLNPSTVVKLSNLFNREDELTPDLYEELYEDMEEEFSRGYHLKKIRIIRSNEERLGAEVGAVFVEFLDKSSAATAIKKMKGRVYDGREVKATYVDEKLYFTDLCPPIDIKS